LPEVFEFRIPLPNLHGTAIERLNSAVPDNIGSNPGSGAADYDVIVYRDTFGPQHAAVVRALVGVVDEGNGRGPTVVGRVGAHTAGITLVPPPVRRDYTIALWTVGGGLWGLSITLAL